MIVRPSQVGTARRMPWQVAGRFAAHLLLYPSVHFAGYIVTMTAFFAHEHPFHSGMGPDYEKFPAHLSAYVVTPSWFVLGALAGLVFSKDAGRRVRLRCLALFAAWLECLRLWRPGPIVTEPWPVWMHALCAFVAAVAVCRYWPLPRQPED